jgi:hypothetical protein
VTSLNAFVGDGKAAVAWATMIAALLLLPGSALPAVPLWIPSTFGGWIDSLIHGILFLAQTWLVLPVGRVGPVIMTAKIWSSVCLAYAVVLEVLQIPVPGRSFQIVDIVFAGLGIGIACFLGRWTARPDGQEQAD